LTESATAPRTIQVFRIMMCPIWFGQSAFKYEKAEKTLQSPSVRLRMPNPPSLLRSLL